MFRAISCQQASTCILGAESIAEVRRLGTTTGPAELGRSAVVLSTSRVAAQPERLALAV